MNTKITDIYFLEHTPSMTELIKLSSKEKENLEKLLVENITATESLLMQYQNKQASCSLSMLNFGTEQYLLSKRKALLKNLRKAKQNENCTLHI